jgi:phage shock protein PspC (stress-responsive transcriptional regulator)
MNQTQGPSTTDEQQSTTAPGTGGPRPGVDRHNLRSYEQLRRSVTDRKIAGVAGGLGRHLDIDPTILRVLFVVLCFFGGAGFVLYGAAWLLVPEDGREEGTIATSPHTRNALLIGAGVIAALLLVGDSWGGIGFPWPLFLVGVAVLLYLVFRDQGSRPEGPSAPPSYAPVYGPAPAGEVDPADVATSTAYAPETRTSYGEQPPAPPWAAPAQQAPAHQPPNRRGGPKLFGFTLALVAVALGALGLYDVAGGTVVDSAYPALALAVVGLMLVVGAFVGRAGGLIFLGLVAAAALAVTSVVGTFSGMDLRDRQQVSRAPTSARFVHSHYSVGTGQLFVDLSEVTDPENLDGRTITVGARAGELVVVLPKGVESDVTADVAGPGQIDLPDRSSGGINTDLAGVYGSGPATVTIKTTLSAGHIDVRNP